MHSAVTEPQIVCFTYLLITECISPAHVSSLTALKVLINVMVVGRAATTLQRQERKHLIGQLRQAQVWNQDGPIDLHAFPLNLPRSPLQHELNIDISRRMHPIHEAGGSAWDSPLRSRNPSETSLSSMARRLNTDMYVLSLGSKNIYCWCRPDAFAVLYRQSLRLSGSGCMGVVCLLGVWRCVGREGEGVRYVLRASLRADSRIVFGIRIASIQFTTKCTYTF